jgi:type IV pilus assembly protein PilB
MSGRMKIDVSKLDRSLTDRLPLYFARKYCLLPVHATKHHIVVIPGNGKGDPLVLGQISDIINERLLPYKLKKYHPDTVRNAVEEFYKGKSLRFGEVLLMNEVISESQLAEVVELQKKKPNQRIGDIVKELGYADEAALQQAFANQLGYRFLKIDQANFLDMDMVKRFPEKLIKEYQILPFPNNDDIDHLFVLASKPLPEEVINEIQRTMKVSRVEVVMTMQEEIEKTVNSVLRRLQLIKSREKSLGKILLERELITEDQLDMALEEQRRNNMKLGEVLIEKRMLPERVVMEAIAAKINADYRQELPAVLDHSLRDKLTIRFATFNKVVPIGEEDGTVLVAMTDPADTNLINTIKSAVNADVRPVLASERQIKEAIRRLYQADKSKGDDSNKKDGHSRLELQKKANIEVRESDDSQYNTERIINTVNNILVEAVLQGASDIHLTPEESGLALYYRIDGSLKRTGEFSYKDKDNIVARIKIMSDMRIDTKHIPQGGRIVSTIDNRHIDFRSSTLPSQYGENVVLRILDNSKMLGSDMKKLGFTQELEDEFLDQCERSQGIVLVTGPTGSGKTTTLYHVLNFLHKTYPAKGISTIENPIEYVMPGIVQSEINEARGLTSAKILKEKLRQDPDVIMVGEIRNLEEASLAFTAALTGHLVLSTLHTNDGASTVRRLVEIGLEPYNVATGINGILSQRLARRLCKRCATDYKPNEREIRKIRMTHPDFDPDQHQFKKGWGCDFCNDGYKGRVGIYELLIIDSEIKELVNQNATDSQIRAAAVRKGMKTLRVAGIDLAFKGVTTIEEVLSRTDIMN